MIYDVPSPNLINMMRFCLQKIFYNYDNKTNVQVTTLWLNTRFDFLIVAIVMSKSELHLEKEHEWLNLTTMQKERDRAIFDVRELTHVLDGGRELTKLYELVCKQLERDPLFQDDGADLTIIDQKRLTMNRMKRLLEYKEKDDEKTFQMRLHVIGLFDSSTHVRFAVHAILFQNALSQNATDEQLQLWWEDVNNLRTIGCFAMVNLI
jgi:hypothetical protein